MGVVLTSMQAMMISAGSASPAFAKDFNMNVLWYFAALAVLDVRAALRKADDKLTANVSESRKKAAK